MKIAFAPKSMVRILTIIIGILFGANCLCLAFIHIFNHPFVFGFVPLFHFDREANIPTLYSALTLLLSGILFLVIGFHHAREKFPFAKSWKALGYIFLFISIDEATKIHELLIYRPRITFDLTGIFYFAWVIPYGLLLFVFAIMFFKFWRQLNKRTRFFMALAGIIYVGGALGIELIGGYYYEAINEKIDLLYDFIVTFEELLEKVGILILLYALLDYCQRNIPSIEIKLKNPG